jgi:hypothetical protein
LPLKEISRYFTKKAPRGKRSIQDLIEEGQEMIVQVDKEATRHKGAALSTFINRRPLSGVDAEQSRAGGICGASKAMTAICTRCHCATEICRKAWASSCGPPISRSPEDCSRLRLSRGTLERHPESRGTEDPALLYRKTTSSCARSATTCAPTSAKC